MSDKLRDAVVLLRKLTACAELNQDEIEPETAALLVEARAFVDTLAPDAWLKWLLDACREQDREMALDALESLNNFLASADGFLPADPPC